MKASTAEAAAVQEAEWKAEAASTGRTLAAVACTAMRARCERPPAAWQAWAEMALTTRSMLLAICTDRADTTGNIRWDQLTEAERIRIGDVARVLLRDLQGRAGLLS